MGPVVVVPCELDVRELLVRIYEQNKREVRINYSTWRKGALKQTCTQVLDFGTASPDLNLRGYTISAQERSRLCNNTSDGAFDCGYTLRNELLGEFLGR